MWMLDFCIFACWRACLHLPSMIRCLISLRRVCLCFTFFVVDLDTCLARAPRLCLVTAWLHVHSVGITCVLIWPLTDFLHGVMRHRCTSYSTVRVMLTHSCNRRFVDLDATLLPRIGPCDFLITLFICRSVFWLTCLIWFCFVADQHMLLT